MLLLDPSVSKTPCVQHCACGPSELHPLQTLYIVVLTGQTQLLKACCFVQMAHLVLETRCEDFHIVLHRLNGNVS